jgi:teichuronic acid biosynthesis glycosyltransferase TuaC
MKVLVLTTEWPTPERPFDVPFVVRQVETLRRKGVEVTVYHFRGNKKLGNYLKAARELSSIVKQGNFDILHAQWGQSALPVFFTSKPLVVTFRGSDLFGITDEQGNYTFKGRVLKFLSKLVALRCSAVILVSKRLIPFVPFKKSYTILPSGIDFSIFKPGSQMDARKKLGWSAEEKIILFGGDPDRTDKRFFLAKQAVDGLGKFEHPVRLAFAKQVAHHEMPAYYQAADVLLLTSKHEGSPNVVKEALACNLPVVSVDVGDVKERIQSIPGCALCPNDDPATITRALTDVLALERKNFNGREFVQDLDEDRIADGVLNIYRKLIAGK